MWENFRKLRDLTLPKASTNLMRIVGEMPRKPSKVSRPNKQRSTVCDLECGKSWMVSAKNVEAPRMSTTTACEIDLEKLLIRGNETSSDVNGHSSIERCLMMTSQKTWWNSQGELRWNEVQSGWRLSSILISMRHETSPIPSKPTMTCAALPPRWLSHFKNP
jgi:hypothetical protein